MSLHLFFRLSVLYFVAWIATPYYYSFTGPEYRLADTTLADFDDLDTRSFATRHIPPPTAAPEAIPSPAAEASGEASEEPADTRSPLQRNRELIQTKMVHTADMPVSEHLRAFRLRLSLIPRYLFIPALDSLGSLLAPVTGFPHEAASDRYRSGIIFATLLAILFAIYCLINRSFAPQLTSGAVILACVLLGEMIREFDLPSLAFIAKTACLAVTMLSVNAIVGRLGYA